MNEAEAAWWRKAMAPEPRFKRMATYCNHMTYPETLETPAEYCDEETVEGSDFCDRHLDDHGE